MPYHSFIERRNKPRSGVALGGLGCGWFELQHDGIFRKWNIFNNRPVAGGEPCALPDASMLFFVLRWVDGGGVPHLRLLQVEESHGSAGIEGHEFHYIFPWIDGVDRIDSSATVPFTNLTFRDQAMPFVVEMRAWSPLIPRNVKDSALPLAFFDFRLQLLDREIREVSIVASLRNSVGHDVKHKLWSAERISETGCQGIQMGATGLPDKHPSAGTLALVTPGEEAICDIGWGHLHPYYEDFLVRGLQEQNHSGLRHGADEENGPLYAKHACYSSVGVPLRFCPAGTGGTTFCVAWDFPHRHALPVSDCSFAPPGYLEETGEENNPPPAPAERVEGHYYRNFFHSAAEVAVYGVQGYYRLKAESEGFHDAFFDSSLPEFLLDQINSHLNTLRTSTWFTLAGDFGVVEGLGLEKSFAGLTTIDVAMYGQILTTALFPELDRAAMRSHARMQLESGIIAHSISHNFLETKPAELSGVRLDLTSQFVVLALRAAWFANDKSFLREIWPAVKKALDYTLRERDHDGDGLPEMEGIMCSYDNFPMFGVAPYVATQWLAAVQAACQAAEELGDEMFLCRFRGVFSRGLQSLESSAWNGSYYRLYAGPDGIDEGCLADQIFGHLATHLSGLPGFLESGRIISSLAFVLKINFRPSQGLRNCQWPGEGFLHPVAEDCWVDQANTCWTGVELAFAAHLLFEGMWDQGIAIAESVDRRYRHSGMVWDHQEYGGHYFRAMSAWGILHAALGYSARAGIITFHPRLPEAEGKLFFSTSDCYGHFEWGPDFCMIRIADGIFHANEIHIFLRCARDWRTEHGGPMASDSDGWIVLQRKDFEPLIKTGVFRISPILSDVPLGPESRAH